MWHESIWCVLAEGVSYTATPIMPEKRPTAQSQRLSTTVNAIFNAAESITVLGESKRYWF